MTPDEELKTIVAGTYVDPVMEDAVVRVEDCARTGRLVYGKEGYAYVAGTFRAVPDHDWRFTAVFADGGSVTFEEGATAEHVAAFLARRRAENGSS